MERTPELITLTFRRHSLADLPERLRALAAKTEDQETRVKIVAAAAVVSGWLSADDARDIRASRPERSWRWLMGACRAAGAQTAGTLIQLKLDQREEAIAEAREQAQRDREIAQAARELRAREAAGEL